MRAEPTTSLICLVTLAVSFFSFRDSALKERLIFSPERILARKEWYRIFSSALIHADWLHLGFNLITLLSFGPMLAYIYGPKTLLAIYLAAEAGGSLLSLYIHRNHDYAALGASGAVCGVLFASIFLVPGTSVGSFFLPFSIPGPIFAAIYLATTFVALRKNEGNVGHDAHFGGALVGLAFAWFIAPERCLHSPLLFGAACLFSVLCLVVLAVDPLAISRNVFLIGEPEHRSNLRYQRYDEARDRNQQQQEIDRILDKISKSGMDGLSKRERAKLDQASSKLSRRR